MRCFVLGTAIPGCLSYASPDGCVCAICDVLKGYAMDASGTTCSQCTVLSNVTTASALENCRSTNGSIIGTTTDTRIAGSCLTLVGGNFEIDGSTAIGNNNVLTAVSLPLLTSVTGYLRVWNSFCCPQEENAALTLIYLPSLSYVASYIFIRYNALVALSLTSLTFVGEFLDIASNSKLVYIFAPVLTKIAGTCSQVLPVTICGGHDWTVNMCGNSDSFSYTTSITRAAAGKICVLTRICSTQVCA